MSATISAEATQFQIPRDGRAREVGRKLMGLANVLFPLVVVGIIWEVVARANGGVTLFQKVVVPGALPFVLTGMRIGLSRSWRAVVAGEMLSAGAFGLGWLIFEARDFVRTDVMLAGVMAIGVIGLILEKVLFQVVEKYTVVRWGMLQDTGA